MEHIIDLATKMKSMSELVESLCRQQGRLAVGGPKPSLQSFRDAIRRRYVLLKFLETRGQTDLGMDLDWDACEVSERCLEAGQGSVHLEGRLTLDFVPVRLVADVDIESMMGTGQLFRI